MTDKQVERLKNTELDLLKEFIHVTDILGLNYYLLGGTLLGAVRHKGFIPWDDDIDVGMLRSDYEIFLEKAPILLKKQYFLQTWKSDPGYPRLSAKLRDSSTTFVESNVKHFSINHGVYIDIFPLDYYPNGKIQQHCFDVMDKMFKIRTRSFLSVPINERRNYLLEYGAKTISAVIGLRYKKIEDVLAARERLYVSVKPSSFIANYNGFWKKKEIVPKQWYGEGIVGSFEGLAVKFPKEYTKWLKQVYGNYMELPPIEKRVSHHNFDLIDLDKPYTFYFGDIH